MGDADVIRASGGYAVHLRDDGPSYVTRHGIRRDGQVRNLEHALACHVRDLQAALTDALPSLEFHVSMVIAGPRRDELQERLRAARGALHQAETA